MATQYDGTAPEAGTLALMRVGECVRIHRIVFGALRSVCNDLGIRENECFRCRVATPSMLVLEADDGHVISLARDWARYIRVEAEPALSQLGGV